MNYLVIVESPNKEKTIKKYLGNNYKVMASVGHIVKMVSTGKERLGIDFQNWEPMYVIDPEKKEVVKKLKDAAKTVDLVYIATDPDREGEAIGDNLVNFLDIKNKYKRIKYNEITKEAILNAIEHPGLIDNNLVNAQKSRRMLDRIIGYKLSGLMTKKMKNAPTRPTAGRVQSIALKLVVDREREIRAFVPITYYTLEANLKNGLIATFFNKTKEENFENREWISPKKIEKIKSSLGETLTIIDKKITLKTEGKIEPYKQANLYKSSEFSSRITQSALQKLYEGFGDGGLISYPRTDSTRLSSLFIAKAREYIASKYGSQYIEDKIKGIAGDQDAHEAIRPTDIHLTPQKAIEKYNLSHAEARIYTLIYNNTLRALIKPPKRQILRYDLETNGNLFKLTSSTILFDGYLVVEGYNQENQLPNYEIGEKLDVKEYITKEHQTKPPARYNDGSLIKKLDEIKVGRPSTFATTVEKILDRQFVEKEGQALKATPFGEQVLDKLIEGFPNEINEDYTAFVEKDLDDIADGKIQYKTVIENFWDRFNKSFKTAELTLEQTTLVSSYLGKKCPSCNEGELLYKKQKNSNNQFIGCDRFPKCKYTESIQKPKKTFSFLQKKKK